MPFNDHTSEVPLDCILVTLMHARDAKINSIPVLDMLHAKGLLPGTSYKEKGVKISVTPQSGETIFFLKIDDPNVCMSIQKDKKCDLLIFYQKEGKTVLCLTEAKGTHVPHAEKQVCGIHEHLTSCLPKTTLKGVQIIWKAYICSNPKSHIEQTKNPDLKKRFGKGVQVSHNGDIGPFLRK